jgi:hypothetical protein
MTRPLDSEQSIDLDTAALVLTAVQAEALTALLTDGELKGTRYPNVEPPVRVALVALGRVEGIDAAEPSAHTVGVLADDGRTWQIVRAGICWPNEVGP